MDRIRGKNWICTILVGIASVVLFRYFKSARRRREDEEAYNKRDRKFGLVKNQ